MWHQHVSTVHRSPTFPFFRWFASHWHLHTLTIFKGSFILGRSNLLYRFMLHLHMAIFSKLKFTSNLALDSSQKKKRRPFEWVDYFSPLHKLNLNFTKIRFTQKTNTTIYKKKHESKMYLLLKMMILQDLPNISFRGFGSCLWDLRWFYLAATQRYASALIGGRVASTLSVLDSYQRWHGLFAQRGGLKRILKKTLSKCVRVSSWWFVWFLCFFKKILRSCENSISFWDQAVVVY